MIALDTNVLVRVLTNDDPEQSAFVSFDRDLAKVAKQIGAKPTVAAP
jgi:predicted nucleic acid-binding protein